MIWALQAMLCKSSQMRLQLSSAVSSAGGQIGFRTLAELSAVLRLMGPAWPYLACPTRCSCHCAWALSQVGSFVWSAALLVLKHCRPQIHMQFLSWALVVWHPSPAQEPQASNHVALKASEQHVQPVSVAHVTLTSYTLMLQGESPHSSVGHMRF